MNEHDTERNAEDFAAMLARGGAAGDAQTEPPRVPVAPPALSTRIIRPEHMHIGSRTEEDFARMVAPLF